MYKCVRCYILNQQFDIHMNSHQEGLVDNCDKLGDVNDLTLEDIHKQLPG